MKRVLPLLVAALMLTGCAATPTPAASSSTPKPSATVSATPEADGSFESIDALRGAFVNAGGTCDNWAQGDASGSWSAYGSCGETGDAGAAVISTYSTNEARDKSVAGAMARGNTDILVGNLWVIQSNDAKAVQGKLGGDFVSAGGPIADQIKAWEEAEVAPSVDGLYRVASLLPRAVENECASKLNAEQLEWIRGQSDEAKAEVAAKAEPKAIDVFKAWGSYVKLIKQLCVAE